MGNKLALVLLVLLFAGAVSANDGPINLQTQSDVSVTTTSAAHVSASSSRRYLLIQNKGSTSIYVKFGSAHSASEGIEIIAGGNFESLKPPIDAIYLKSASGTQTVAVLTGK